MFKNMKLGTKITVGFGAILVIAIFLGTLATVSMNGVKVGALQLSKERVPEVSIANNVERWSLKTMYEMRGYTLSEEQKYFEKANINLEEVKKYLTQAEELSNKSANLDDLKQNAAKAKAKVLEYEKLAKDTSEVIKNIFEARDILAKAAENYMSASMKFLNSQETKLEYDINTKVAPDKLKERYKKIRICNEIIDLGNELRISNFKSQALRDFSIIKSTMKNFEQVQKKLDEVKAKTHIEEDLKDIEIVRESANSYKDELNKLISNYERLTDINNKRDVVAEDVLKAAEDTALTGMEKTTKIANDSTLSLGAASVTMILGLIGAIALGIILAYIIVVSITKPVNRIVSKIRDGAEQVASASEQLSSASQKLAEGASEQASALEETSSTLNESSSMVQQNTENTKQAAIISDKAKEAATKGNREMDEMNTAMAELKKSSEEISKIIKVIDDIAFQTNILALNAAVEAARAGEAGMGFAVVAEEVRNLAQRSAQAAKDTSSMIEKNLKLSDRGVDVSKKVAESLFEIMGQSKKVNELMDEIAAASQEQSKGIEQINRAVNQMEQVTQSSASSAEESAAASEQLSAQALSMKDVIDELSHLVYGAEESRGMAYVSEKPKYTPQKSTQKIPRLNSSNRNTKSSSSNDPVSLKDDMGGF